MLLELQLRRTLNAYTFNGLFPVTKMVSNTFNTSSMEVSIICYGIIYYYFCNFDKQRSLIELFLMNL